MKTLGYYNGKIGELEDMTVPMLDRVCYFGDGVYDATYSRNHKIYNLDAHLDRFYSSAKLLDIVIPMEKAAWKEVLIDLVKKVDDGEQFVYWQVTRGTALRDHAYPDCPANLWVMLKPAKTRDLSQPCRLQTMEDTRFLHCNIKTLNLIPSVVASQRAKEAGCEETVFHRGQRVTECAHSNVSILKDGVLITAPTDNLILPGTARKKLLQMADKLGIPSQERPFTLSELFDADEVIVTSAGTFCLSAREIDGKPVGCRDPQRLEALKAALIQDFLDETAE